MNERRTAASMGDRWRQMATQGVDDAALEKALASLPSMRSPRIRVSAGSIQAEMEGAMGSIYEVSIHVPRLPNRIWPQIVRVMRRSQSMQDALRNGQVPRSFDRLVARISGESILPETRRVTAACSIGQPETAQLYIQALHELFARGLDDKPWEILILRGVDLRKLLKEAAIPTDEGELPPLSFGAAEEPILFPEGADGDLGSTLNPGQVRRLIGAQQSSMVEVVATAIDDYRLGGAPAAADDAEPTAPPA